MNQSLRVVLFSLSAFAGMSACQASPNDIAAADSPDHGAAGKAAIPPNAARMTGTKVTNENVPIHQRFRSLDEYLAHLERTEGPVDGPWYKQVSPGIYELQTGNLRLDEPSGEKRTFTRQELAEKFGFST